MIIGHSQFEKIALSPEKQKALLQEEINQVTDAITTYQMEDGSDSWSLKQMIAFEKRLEERLEKLNKTDKKDHQLCFEDLGVDFYLWTKPTNTKICIATPNYQTLLG